ncbi:MAG: hypothetical protein ACP5FZ_06055 [Fidelibacterota bacterium]
MHRLKQHWRYWFLLLIIGQGIIRADVNLWVLSFDNLYSDSEIQWLKEGFVDFILDHYVDNPYVAAYRSAELDETLATIKTEKYRQSRNLLLTGTYQRSRAEFIVDLQLTDLETWKTVSETQVRETSPDLEKLILAVNKTLDQLIDPQIEKKLSESTTTPVPQTQTPDIRQERELQSSREMTVATRNIGEALERLLTEYRDHTSMQIESPEPFQQSRFQEDAFTGRVKEYIRESHSFEEVINYVLSDPYLINIGEPSIQRLPGNSSSVSLSFRIDYQIKLKILRDMLETLVIRSKKEGDSFLEYSFSGNDYVFTADLIRKVAHGEYRYFPVIALVDENGMTLARIIDAPSNSGRLKHFNPMFNIITGPWTMTIYLNKEIQEIDYQLVLPISTVAKIAQVTIDMVTEDEIAYLKSQ